MDCEKLVQVIAFDLRSLCMENVFDDDKVDFWSYLCRKGVRKNDVLVADLKLKRWTVSNMACSWCNTNFCWYCESRLHSKDKWCAFAQNCNFFSHQYHACASCNDLYAFNFSRYKYRFCFILCGKTITLLAIYQVSWKAAFRFGSRS